MPTLDFKGKQFIYGHHLTVPVPYTPDRYKQIPYRQQPRSLTQR